jgi:hypothetical protein
MNEHARVTAIFIPAFLCTVNLMVPSMRIWEETFFLEEPGALLPTCSMARNGIRSARIVLDEDKRRKKE